MPEQYSVGKIIKELRIEKKLTQKQLATQIGLTTTAVSKYELGESQPPLDVLRILASVFGVSMDYLAGTDKVPSISAVGLTNEQYSIVNNLADLFRKQNSARLFSLEQEQYSLLGSIVTEFARKQY